MLTNEITQIEKYIVDTARTIRTDNAGNQWV
jgi:hypothetical protein